MKPTKQMCWAVLIGLALGIPIGWFVRPSDNRYTVQRGYTGWVRIDKSTGSIEFLSREKAWIKAIDKLFGDEALSWDEARDEVAKLSPPFELSYEQAIENKKKFENSRE